MSDFILIDSKTRAPVPLPFATLDYNKRPVTVTGFVDPSKLHTIGWIETNFGRTYPCHCNLEIITESDFMAERS